MRLLLSVALVATVGFCGGSANYALDPVEVLWNDGKRGLAPGDLQSNSHLGYTMATLGDLDGDQVPDVAVGSMEHKCPGQTVVGCVFVFRMNRDGTVKAQSFIGGSAYGDGGDRFAKSVAALGDWDSDGVPDLLVGMPFRGGGKDERIGGAYAILLTASGGVKAKVAFDSSTALKCSSYGLFNAFDCQGPIPAYARAGTGVAGADVDGDGLADLILAASEAKGSLQRLAVIFTKKDGSGRPTTKSKSVLTIGSVAFGGTPDIPGDSFSNVARFGDRLEVLPDLDGNGVPDLLVTLMDDNSRGSSPVPENRLLLLSLTSGGGVGGYSMIDSSTTAALSAYTTPWRYFGSDIAVTSYEVVDGSGQLVSKTMVAIGVAEWDTDELQRTGAVVILQLNHQNKFEGSPVAVVNAGTVAQISSGSNAGRGLTWWTDSAVNGRPVLLVGAPKRSYGGTSQGGMIAFASVQTPASSSAAGYGRSVTVQAPGNGLLASAGGTAVTVKVQALSDIACWPAAATAMKLRSAEKGDLISCSDGSPAYSAGEPSQTLHGCNTEMTFSCVAGRGGYRVTGLVAQYPAPIGDMELPISLDFEPPEMDWTPFEAPGNAIPTSKAAITILTSSSSHILGSSSSGGFDRYSVQVGEKPCSSLQRQNGRKLSCTLPRCLGGPYSLQFLRDGAVVSAAPTQLYYPPEPAFVVYENPPPDYIPASVIKLPEAAGDATIGITGLGFAVAGTTGNPCTPATPIDAGDRYRVDFGNADAGTWTAAGSTTLHNDTYLKVTNPQITEAMRDLRVVVFGSAVVMRNVVRLDGPAVSDASPAVVLQADTLNVYGTNFGNPETDVVTVTVGTFPCTGVSLEAIGKLSCTITDGFGVDLEVLVTVNGRVSSEGSTVSYKAGTISSATPDYSFVGQPGELQSFVINSTGAMAKSVSQISNVFVADSPCQSFSLITFSSLQCNDVDTSLMTRSSRLVKVVVGAGSLLVEPTFTFTLVDKPVVTFVSSGALLQVGTASQDVVVAGRDFGFDSSDLVSAKVGPYDCTNPRRESPIEETNQQVTCTLIGGGIGRDWPVLVKTRGGYTSSNATTARVSFAAPTISALSPDRASGGNISYQFSIIGENLGTAAEPPTSATVGGFSCSSLELIDSTNVTCRGIVPLTAAGESFSTGQVTVLTGGQLGQSAPTLLTYTGSPVVNSVIPPVIASGGELVTIFGSDLGVSDGDLPGDGVTIGGKVCSDLQWHNSFKVSCMAPPGSGAQVLVHVRTRGGLESPSDIRGQVYYDYPSISNVSPGYAVSGGNLAHNFTIDGSGFGWAQSDLEQVFVGGVDCSPFTLEWVNHTRIRCVGLVTEAWISNTVSVTISGQTTSLPGFFQFVGVPVVSSVSPSSYDSEGGKSLSIVGANFGNDLSDLKAVYLVNSDGYSEECSNLQFAEDTTSQLTCTVPPGAGARRVEVESAGGARSKASTPQFRYNLPSVTSVSPSILYNGQLISFDLLLRGTSFGHVQSDISQVKVGGQSCFSYERVNSTALWCRGLTPPFTLASVEVGVRGQAKATGGLVELMQKPSIDLLLPQSGSGDNVTHVTVTGRNFADKLSNLRGVIFGEGNKARVLPPESWQWEGRGAMAVSVPPGNSKVAQLLRIVQVGGEVNGFASEAAFTYSQPVVTSTSPPVLLSGATGAIDSLVINGLHFGHQADTVAAITVSGNPCASVEWVSSSELRCGGLPSGEWTSMDGDIAIVQRERIASTFEQFQVIQMLEGESKALAFLVERNLTAASVLVHEEPPQYDEFSRTFSGAVRIAPPPAVATVLVGGDGSKPTKGGFEISITGNNFGVGPADISGVQVGGVAVREFEWVSETSLKAIVAPGCGSGLDVQVTNRLGGLSSPNSLLSFDAPLLTSVTPSYLFAGEQHSELVVNGTNLCGANGVDDVLDLAVLVGQDEYGCSSVGLVAADCSALRCYGLSIPAAATGHASLRLRLVSQAARGQPVGALTANDLVASRQTRADMFAVLGRPTVQLMNPSSMSIFGSEDPNVLDTNCEIQGLNFGGAAGDVIAVEIGGHPSLGFSVTGPTRINALIPPGVGSNVYVNVTTRGKQWSDPGNSRLFSYSPPQVGRLSPDYSVTGDIVADFNVTGSQLGLRASDVGSVTIGGRPCATVKWESPDFLRCFGVDGAKWSSSEVVVVVGGQRSLPNAVFQSMGTPVVSDASPTTVGAGDTVFVLGEDFGKRPSDVINVTLDGIPCKEFSFKGSTAVSCVVPEPRAWRYQQALAGNPAALSKLNIAVTTAGGQVSVPNQLMQYNQAGDPPPDVPDPVSGWRVQGVDGSVELNWVYPKDDKEDNIPPIQNFVVESVWHNSSGHTLTAVDRIAYAATQVAPLTIDDKPFEALSFILRGAFGVKPISLRMAAENEIDIGPFSGWSPLITESCAADELLQTHLPPPEWTCAPCPTGAFCGGLPYERMVPLAGYWRVPWSPYQLMFERCPFADSCNGFAQAAAAAIELASQGSNDTEGVAANGEGGGGTLARRRLQALGRQGVPLYGLSALVQEGEGGLVFSKAALRVSIVSSGNGTIAANLTALLAGREGVVGEDSGSEAVQSHPLLSQLVPEVGSTVTAQELQLIDVLRLEAAGGGDNGGACDYGYTGNLCTSCRFGFARKGVNECVECIKGWMVYAALIGVILLVVAVVSFMIMQAIKSEGRESRPETVLMKILFTHMQQIAIASSFDLEWPDLVVSFYQLLDTFSSVSENMLSLDCIVPEDQRPGGSVFYSKSLLMMFTPLIVFLVISSFWAVLATTPRRSCGSVCKPKDKKQSLQRVRRQSMARLRAAGKIQVRQSMGGSQALQGDSRSLMLVASRSEQEHIRSAVADKKAGELEDAFGDDEEQAPTSRGFMGLLGRSSRRSNVGGPGSSTRGKGLVGASSGRSGGLMGASSGRSGGLMGASSGRSGGLMGTALAPGSSRMSTMSLAGASNARDDVKVTQSVSQRGKKVVGTELRAQASDRFGACCSKEVFMMRRRWLRDRTIVSLIVTAFLIHATLTKSVLRLFTCTSIGEGDSERSYLQFDMQVRCDSPTASTFMAAMGLPAFVLYALGIPAMAYWVLRSRRKKLSTRRVRATYGFLYAGNKVRFYYWESVVMLRKVALSVVAVFLAPAGVAFQTYTAVLVIGLAVAIQARFMPYNRKLLNYFELLSLLTAFVTMVAGLYLSDPLSSRWTRLVATMVIMGTNCALIAGFLAKLLGGGVVILLDRAKERRLKTSSTDAPFIRPAARAKAKVQRAIKKLAISGVIGRLARERKEREQRELAAAEASLESLAGSLGCEGHSSRRSSDGGDSLSSSRSSRSVDRPMGLAAAAEAAPRAAWSANPLRLQAGAAV